MEEKMQDIIDDKQRVIDELTKATAKLQGELKQMKETCTCKEKVGENPVSKRARGQGGQKP